MSRVGARGVSVAGGGSTLSRGHSTCKDPEVGALLAPSKNSKEARMAAGQGASRRGAGDEAHDHWVVESGAGHTGPYRCLKGRCLYLDLEWQAFPQV